MQVDLFGNTIEDETISIDDLFAPHGKCGQCRWMDCTLPGTNEQLGRCVNPESKEYYLSTENARVCPVAGAPPHGSWHFVGLTSAACDKISKVAR